MKINPLLITLLMLSMTVLSSCGDDDPEIPADIYVATLEPMNSSGVEASVTLTIKNNTITVNIEASGMTPNQVHPQHIHGEEESAVNSVCPPNTADTDENGVVSLEEGLPYYGPVRLALEPFPTADASGNINYEATFTLGTDGIPTLEEFIPFENRSIVLHGMIFDGTYMETLPVACGQITEDN